jgi:hypothetical protein
MGMFDDIRCEYPLPLPIDQGELAGKDWSKHGFQTKDLGKGMDGYCIRADGTLWIVRGRWLGDDREGENFLKGFFGTVEFYGFIYGRKNDYSIEWEAKFAEGKLADLRLKEWRSEDNSGRLQQEAKWQAERQRVERFQRTWVGRFIYPPYAWIVRIVVKLAVKATYAIPSFLHRMEYRLTPYGNPIATRRMQRGLEEYRGKYSTEETKPKPDDKP